jgi:hypothetical protein
MDFDEAVNQALPEVAPEKPKKTRKRKGQPLEIEEVKKPKTEEEEDPEQQAQYAQLVRFCEAFPECADGIMVAPDAPPAEIEFQLAMIQRRINAKNERGIMRAGLVTGCMVMEGASAMVGSPVLLKGFGHSVQAASEQFDDVLKQILCKYGGNFAISCEATLGLLLLRHAASVHMANALEKKKEEVEEPTPDSTSLPQ